MTLNKYLEYIKSSNICPPDINEYRWNAMLIWLNTRLQLKDGVYTEPRISG